jgi:nitroreductase
MDVLEAIQTRHSVRDFLPQPVPLDTVLCILDAATRTPSGGNGQPWEIFVASGRTLERIRAAYIERAQAGPGPANAPAAPPQPPAQPAFIRERMETIRSERMKLLGLDPADPASGKVFMEWGARLFGAPVVVVLCMDQALSAAFDLGMLAQTICLAAQGFGVDSLIAAAFIRHADILRKELEIPENLKLVMGIGLGYANSEAIINTYRSPRRPIEDVVRLKN